MNIPTTIELRKTDELVPYARNSRTHPEEQVAQIAASIREFGWTNPVLVDGDGGIIAGHARVLAARKLGMAEVPVIVLDHLTEAQRRALVIADNKLAENAGWDEELLRSELAALRDLDVNLGMVGFEPDELRALFAELDPDEANDEVDGDAAEPNIQIALSVPGVVWLGNRDAIIAAIENLRRKYLFTYKVAE